MKERPSFIVFSLILIFAIGFIPRWAYANETKKDIDKKVNEQNKDIKEKLKDSPLPSNGDKLEDVFDQYQENKDNSSGNFDGEGVKSKLKGGLLQLTVGFRKYAIPIYILIELILTILISTVGVKNLQKRKGYIVMIISFTVVFLFILNIPILAIYFQNRAVEEVLGSGGIYNAIYGLINFLQENSLVIAILIIIYGITNIILSKNDLPRRMAGFYMIKFSIISLIVLQTLPLIIKLIV